MPPEQTIAAVDDFTVVVCTRNRRASLARTLDALEAQDDGSFSVMVIDQSDEIDPDLAGRERRGRLRVVRDGGRGLSRARNLAWRQISDPWVVYMDDDCLPERGWAAMLREALSAHPEAAFISGHVGENTPASNDQLVVTSYPVTREVVRRGRWTWPWAIGFGVCMAIRRDWIDRVGGWDERLGPGGKGFPASDDMDFNYRLLRAGAVAVAVPGPRVLHDQWRTGEELVSLYHSYALGWAGFAAKHLRSADAPGGIWLWAWGAYAYSRMLASAFKRRSRLRLRVAIASWRGHLLGTVRGLSRRW